MPDLQACVTTGGVFALVIPPVAGALFALEIVWLVWIVVRDLKRRTDLMRIRDLVIEGSLAQAILVADAKSRDDLLAVCRTAIVTVQSTGARQQAWDKLVVEAGYRYAGARKALPRILLLALIVAVPVGLTLWSRTYADKVAFDAAAAVSEGERADVLRAVQEDPAFDCPVWLGFGAAIACAIPAIAIAGLEGYRTSYKARDAAVYQADQLAEMAVRVLDPSHRVYREERARRTA
ncbi:MAG TPA: hypothetical protein VMV18_14835 [bacterium]|nr:hypothetical protein [bacterium]